MASSSSKSARLLSGIEGVSDRALSRILAAIKTNPAVLSDANSRQTLNRRALSAANEVGIVKHAIALTKGLPIVWEVLTLQDLLPY